MTATRILQPVNTRWASRLGVGTGVVAVAVVVGLIILDSAAWTMAPLIPMGLFFIFQGVLTGRARVEVAPDSLKVIDLRRPRGRTIPKASINGMRIDPPGGLRQIHLRLDTGEDVTLPPLNDADSDVVMAACSSS